MSSKAIAPATTDLSSIVDPEVVPVAFAQSLLQSTLEADLPPRPSSVPVTNIDTAVVNARQNANGPGSSPLAKTAGTSDTLQDRPSPKSSVDAHKGSAGKHSAIAKAAITNKTKVLNGLGKDTLSPSSANGGSMDGVHTPMRSSDTPLSTAPNSPKIIPASSPRIHATTLNIPGVTRSKVSLDGRIPNRDLGSKLIIIMVGLPARGKSYITKKLRRYLNWLQYNVEIFNVGNRRRVAAKEPTKPYHKPSLPFRGTGLLNGFLHATEVTITVESGGKSNGVAEDDNMDQSAQFFDPHNTKAAQLREKVALETLMEALEYLIAEGGNVSILDATNSTQERRKALVETIREKAGDQLQILFIESICEDEMILEANMRLKLSGPDYKDQDPVKALADFKKRVQMYEGAYCPIGEYEESMGWQYIKLIDVGRKFVAHGTRGFLANHTAYYLMNFNLAPRQIWITRHGESTDNVLQRIGGDASLTAKGDQYAHALASFIDGQRKEFHTHLLDKHAAAQGPPRAGDITPPNPESSEHFIDNKDGEGTVPYERNFCVWTSMLKRSMETGKYFDDEEYDLKQWRILDELNAGHSDGMTYEEIKAKFPEEYAARRANKLEFRYPGPGGESYMDVIHRMKELIVEVERMQDHVLLLVHRVVARVLLAYFMGLDRSKVADLDIPLGHVYVLEPRPYGVDFKAYVWDSATNQFNHIPGYKLVLSTAEKHQREIERQEQITKIQHLQQEAIAQASDEQDTNNKLRSVKTMGSKPTMLAPFSPPRDTPVSPMPIPDTINPLDRERSYISLNAVPSINISQATPKSIESPGLGRDYLKSAMAEVDKVLKTDGNVKV